MLPTNFSWFLQINLQQILVFIAYLISIFRSESSSITHVINCLINSLSKKFQIAITCSLLPVLAPRDSHRQPEIARDCQRQPELAQDSPRQPEIARDSPRQPEIARDSPRQFQIVWYSSKLFKTCTLALLQYVS